MKENHVTEECIRRVLVSLRFGHDIVLKLRGGVATLRNLAFVLRRVSVRSMDLSKLTVPAIITGWIIFIKRNRPQKPGRKHLEIFGKYLKPGRNIRRNLENIKSPPEKLRAKRAKIFGAFWPLYRGKSSKNGQNRCSILGFLS